MDIAMQQILQRAGIALALGMLVGLQRQHDQTRVAGQRTVPIVTVMGLLAALTDLHFSSGPWVTAAIAIGVTSVMVVGELMQYQKDKNTGITTSVAVLFMFLLGAYLAFGNVIVAVVMGAGLAALLQFKPELHALAKRFSDHDLRAIMQFVLFSMVILPILPNQSYGPLDAFNPFETWLMVVLIVGISLGGYIAYKFFGRNTGTLLSGVLGGAISSTATTISYSRRSDRKPSFAPIAAVVIMVASTLVFVRVLIEIAVVAPRHLWQLAPPIVAMLLAGIVGSLAAWIRVGREEHELPLQSNPTEFQSALMFGAFYAGVKFALAAANKYWGSQGLYTVASLSGLTDMDAITLTTARLVDAETAGGIAPSLGWRLIVVASISNLVFKAAIVLAIGHRPLLRQLAPMYALPLGVGILLLLL
jgi:uncharacterized membrane protein (DUF4010 family)